MDNFCLNTNRPYYFDYGFQILIYQNIYIDTF